MKNKSILLLTFLAIVLFVIMFIPSNVFAIEVITEIKISTSQVKHGSTISTIATIDSVTPAGAMNDSTIEWLVSDNSSGTPFTVATGTFEGGKYYAWGFDILNMNSNYVFQEGVTKYYINDVEYTPQTFVKLEKVSANITINDYSTLNRGKFAIANDVNSNKPESTSILNVDFAKDSTATLYVTPELDYLIEKITVDGTEISFEKDNSASGVNKPYKATITMDTNKDIVIYFKEKKILNYSLEVVKKDLETEKVESNVNIEQLINQKKDDFISKINEFKADKENVIELSDDIISSLFTENKYAIITAINYKDSSYEASDDLIAIGDLDNWDNLDVAQGCLKRTDNYEIEYIEVAVEEAENTENPATGDTIILVAVGLLISTVGLYVTKNKFTK